MTGRELLAGVEHALVEHFGQVPARASVSFLGVEPLEVLRFEPLPGHRAYLSLGMSRRAMTPPTETVLEPVGPRAELMMYLRDETDRYAEIWRALAVLAASPAVEGVVYAAGMTVDTGQPLAPGSACTGGLIMQSPLAPIETAVGPVDVLQVLPATPTELAWCRVQGSAALQDRWTAQGADLLDLGRRGVPLG